MYDEEDKGVTEMMTPGGVQIVVAYISILLKSITFLPSVSIISRNVRKVHKNLHETC